MVCKILLNYRQTTMHLPYLSINLKLLKIKFNGLCSENCGENRENVLPFLPQLPPSICLKGVNTSIFIPINKSITRFLLGK